MLVFLVVFAQIKLTWRCRACCVRCLNTSGIILDDFQIVKAARPPPPPPPPSPPSMYSGSFARSSSRGSVVILALLAAVLGTVALGQYA